MKENPFSGITDKDKKRFWKKVNKKSDDECWDWIASKDAKGYGHFNLNYKIKRAHRISYMIFHNINNIPKGKCVCHKCDNPSCVNPNHLFLGTNYDNVMDRVDKNRSGAALGEKHGNVKLTKENVIFIRDNYANGNFSMNDLAKKFNVYPTMIGRIVRGKNWKHVGGKISKYKKGIKLTENEVRQIKDLLKNTSLTQKEIGIKYHVSATTISYISLGKRWSDIDNE